MFILSVHKFRVAELPLAIPQFRLGAVEAEHQEGIFLGIGDDGVAFVAFDRLGREVEVDGAVRIHLLSMSLLLRRFRVPIFPGLQRLG